MHEALLRSVTHTAYHVGQIVYLAKSFRGEGWTSLSIPPGQSDVFNRKLSERPEAPHPAGSRPEKA